MPTMIYSISPKLCSMIVCANGKKKLKKKKISFNDSILFMLFAGLHLHVLHLMWFEQGS